jgi:seryl-tRNA synthetase
MLDIRELRKDPEGAAAALARRGFEFDPERFRALDAQRREADIESQNLRAERKAAAKKVGQLIAQGMSVDDAKAEVDTIIGDIANRLDAATEAERRAQGELDSWLQGVPNLPHPDVPPGASEEDNVEMARWGEPPAFDFAARDHVDIGESLGLFDTETAGKITGARFTILYGPLARLHRALIQFMLDLHTTAHGYREVYVPYIVNGTSLQGTGQLPKFADELFRLEGDQDYYLIPTAEVPVTNIAREHIFEDRELGEEGLAYACHTPCFRSEAGSYGRDTRGMIRQHQFEKVELVRFARPQQSEQALERLTADAETVLQRLELPYRKVLLCGGDLGFSACKTYDLEVWLPGQACYREISSCSNFGDFQARRMQARWRNPETGKPELLHTLNGSGLAVGRTLVALLENGQRADGSVALPPALQPYLGGLAQLGPPAG